MVSAHSTTPGGRPRRRRRRSDASKIALAALVCLCREHGIAWIDCQQNTRHLASLGAFELPRAEFEAHLARTVTQAAPTNWQFSPALWRHLQAESASASAAMPEQENPL